MCISPSLHFWLIRIRMRSWELFGESCVVLLGFLTLAVSLGNLSTRGLQVRWTTRDNNLKVLCERWLSILVWNTTPYWIFSECQVYKPNWNKILSNSAIVFCLCLSAAISLFLSHLRSLSGISSVSHPFSRLLSLTPLQGAQCTFQWSLW